MRLARPFRPAFSALVLASAGIVWIVPVQADAMRAWNGASASTIVFDQNSSQRGATAAASAAGAQNVEYYGRGIHDWTYHVHVNGSASANATGSPDRLLSVQSHYQAPSPGTLGYNHGSGPVAASASWTNDAVIVMPPVGGTLPESVQLQFALTFALPYASDPDSTYFHTGTIQLRANNQSYSIHSKVGWPSIDPGSGFDSVTISSPESPSAVCRATGEFHLDLPLSKSGVSDPFQLTLESRPVTGLESNSRIWIDHDAVLSLKDVTFPDGTPLKSVGYSFAFESGMPGWPSAVPEPASLACWGLAALAAGWTRRRRDR